MPDGVGRWDRGLGGVLACSFLRRRTHTTTGWSILSKITIITQAKWVCDQRWLKPVRKPAGKFDVWRSCVFRALIISRSSRARSATAAKQNITFNDPKRSRAKEFASCKRHTFDDTLHYWTYGLSFLLINVKIIHFTAMFTHLSTQLHSSSWILPRKRLLRTCNEKKERNKHN